IVGGCNCQFALNPDRFEYAVIEVNPRVSRSSALASKATGYPIAKVTTKLALGYTLDEITNDITGRLGMNFEPAVDYVVLKFPKWPFDKFAGTSRKLGTQMKATGEVMSIAPSFEMALMKAVRGAEISLETLNAAPLDDAPLTERLKRIDDRRIFTVFEAIKAGMDIDTIYDITRIDRFFLYKLKKLADFEQHWNGNYAEAKRLGYPDSALKKLFDYTPELPQAFSYKMVDTCAGAYAAQKPYFYSTADAECESRSWKRSGKPVVLVLGSGPIRIGQGIEFDYSSVHSVWTLKEMGYEVVIINNNPETVSTDYDTADRLYFEPLCPEDVMNIIRVEKPVGVVVAFGGQTAIKLTQFLDQSGIPILGTSAEGIDLAEDRERFDALLEEIGVRRPSGKGVKTLEEALEAAEELEYPVLLRPSYVIGGQNMKIVHNADEVRLYMDRILAQGIENPVLVDKYMMGTELEVDVISDGKDVLIPGVMEHIERAGVHSGDSIAVYPPYNLNDRMLEKLLEVSEKLALALGTQGLVNIQYLIYQNELFVIEVNPRASRTIPYISKVTGVPMVDLASKVMLGQPLKELGYGTGLYRTPPYFAVKVPVFSFEKLEDVNAYMGPEMKSTGEVLGLGKTVEEALFKGLCAAGFKMKDAKKEETGFLLSVDIHDRLEVVGLAKKLDDLGFKLYATEDTAEAIRPLGLEVVSMPGIGAEDHIFELLESGKVSYILYTGALLDSSVEQYIALHRRALQLSIPCLTSLDTANALADSIASRFNQQNTELVDINNLRQKREELRFAKMQATGDDYILIENFNGRITCPESLCVGLCDRYRGIGGYGLVLMEHSAKADVKMRIFNRDGSEGAMGGNCIRSVAKYLYDKGLVHKERITVETNSGIITVRVYTAGGKVNYASVHMGSAVLETACIPCTLPVEKVVDHPIEVAGRTFHVTCVNVGNPHCVVFCERVDTLDLKSWGPLFEHHAVFPQRTNTEFVRVVNPTTIKMRVYERGNGETSACGTGACAAVVAAVENGLCKKDTDITVKVRGGDLLVRYSDEGLTLSGETVLVYEGVTTY
ncbi:MAG: carbamoyl-phosphate synthase large subunit, partial [Clostridia bacterium]|nr:carbamoyl-phosphate synthase large subunit [Clostridia bacterium]